MKKTLSGFLLGILLLSACGAPAGKKVWTYTDMVVGFIRSDSEGRWRGANIADFRETASALGVTLKTTERSVRMPDADFDDFRIFTEDESVNVIVLSSEDPSGWNDLFRQAKDAGKIVILEDRRVDVPEDLYTTYVGSDYAEEGRRAALEMCRLLEGGGKKKVWELAGNPGSSAASDRGRGFREGMDQCGMEVAKSRSADWNSSEGKRVTSDWLAADRDVRGIFAQNDEMGLGAIEALREAGLRPGVDVKIVSIDATSAAFDAMLAGELNAAVECNPLLAPQVYEAALRALNGETLPKWIPTIETVFRSGMPGLKEIAAGRKY